MSTYYKHTRTETAKVPYSFQCEHCLKDSGRLTAVIAGVEATHNSNFKLLTPEETEKLEREAHKNLAKRIKSVHEDATRKQSYPSEFKDICPYCQKPQSWAISGMKKNVYKDPLVYLVVGIIVCVFTYIYEWVEDVSWGLTPIYIIMGIAAFGALVSLLWNLAKIASKQKAASAASRKNLPEIDWSPVRELLN